MDGELDKISGEGPWAWKVYFSRGTICARHKTTGEVVHGFPEVAGAVGEVLAESYWRAATQVDFDDD